MAEKSFVFEKSNCYTGVRDNGTKIGFMATGKLQLGDKKFSVVSGPWNKGVLPDGEYGVKKFNVVAASPNPSFKSPSGVGWFIPMQSPITIERSGFGIHPDGNVTGTAGCIGIIGDEADKFWKLWLSLSMAERPSKIIVRGGTSSCESTYSITGNAANE